MSEFLSFLSKSILMVRMSVDVITNAKLCSIESGVRTSECPEKEYQTSVLFEITFIAEVARLLI